ncbi:MAG: hypothetical protein ACJAQ3_002859 [Planctomycetota bacterium]|jgi:hypothetical protein
MPDRLDPSEPAKPAPRHRPMGSGIPAALLVSAIAVLVVVVSMPRFRAHVLDANRKDAKLTIGLLGGAVFRNSLPRGLPMPLESKPASPDEISSSLRASGAKEPGLYELVLNVKRLDHRFPDARTTETAGELLHHGYRFATGYVHRNLTEELALVAWPDAYGKSGDIAFATTKDGSIYGHPNRGLWSGSERASAVQDPAELLPGGTQALFHVDLSDESWVRVTGPVQKAEPAAK